MVLSGITRSKVTEDYQDEDSKYLRKMIKTAIEERNEGILNLAYGKTSDSYNVKALLSSWRDDQGNTILHLAAKRAPPRILDSFRGGPAFQMRQDLKWFKKVKTTITKDCRLIKNGNQETAKDIFDKEHKGLVKEGEEFMRSRATLLMLPACIIAFTMQRSLFGRTYNSSTDEEITVPFMEYLAFTSSLISVASFLLIRGSTFVEVNFLTSWPLKLVIGQATFIFSLAMMIATFTADYEQLQADPTALPLFALIPLLMLTHAFSQVISLMEMLRYTTYGQTDNFSHDQDELRRELLDVHRIHYYNVRSL